MTSFEAAASSLAACKSSFKAKSSRSVLAAAPNPDTAGPLQVGVPAALVFFSLKDFRIFVKA